MSAILSEIELNLVKNKAHGNLSMRY